MGETHLHTPGYNEQTLFYLSLSSPRRNLIRLSNTIPKIRSSTLSLQRLRYNVRRLFGLRRGNKLRHFHTLRLLFGTNGNVPPTNPVNHTRNPRLRLLANQIQLRHRRSLSIFPRPPPSRNRNVHRLLLYELLLWLTSYLFSLFITIRTLILLLYRGLSRSFYYVLYLCCVQALQGVRTRTESSFFFHLLSNIFSGVDDPHPRGILRYFHLMSFRGQRSTPFFHRPFYQGKESGMVGQVLHSTIDLLLYTTITLNNATYNQDGLPAAVAV